MGPAGHRPSTRPLRGPRALGIIVIIGVSGACGGEGARVTAANSSTGGGPSSSVGQGGVTKASGSGGAGGAGGSGGTAGSGGGSIDLQATTRWRSDMYPENWTPAMTDRAGRFIHDFSYAGYHKGEIAIPSVIPGISVKVTDPPYLADPTGVQDSRAAIQQAIDDVGSQGGGIVLLPAGTFRVKPASQGDKSSLYIKHDGVVLRGAGRDLTYLFNDETYMRGRSVIYLSPPKTPSWWYDEGDEVLLTANASNRATQLKVLDASAYSVGDFIIVRADATDAWVAEHNMTGMWNAQLVRGPISLRQITAINGLDITIDIPLRYPLLTRDSARILRARKQLREVGLEDFSIGGREHPWPNGFGDLDYNVEGTGGYEVHNAWLVTMLGVVDGWVRRVGSYQPPSNAGPYHSVSNGLRLYHTRNVTIEDVMIHHPQYEGGGGNGYPFLVQGSDNLIVDCAAVSGRHAYSFKSMTTSGNVLLESSSSHPRYGTDFHMHLAMSNLIDSPVLEKDYIDATYRPYGSAHGYTTTQTVIWNGRGLGYHLDKDYIVDSRQFAWGLVIGSEGVAPGIKTLPLLDTKDTSPEDYREGEGHGGTLQPHSLYRDQLARRLNGGKAPSYLAELEVLAPTDDTFTRGGSYAGDNYGTEKLLHVKDASSDYVRHSYLKFDLNVVQRPITRAALLVYARTADQGGTHSDIRVHGVANDNWFENTVSYTNQPALGPYLSKMIVDNKSTWRAIDVTAFVQAQQDGDGTVSFALTQQMNADGLFVQFASKEAAADHPKLEIVLGPAQALNGVSAIGAVSDPATKASNAIDQDLSTRWSNDSHGATLTVDLGSEHLVDAASVAFYRGDQRIAFFELRASVDNKSWTTMYAGQSRGDSNSRQVFAFDPLAARYLRYVGFGNSQNSFNSVTELLGHGK